jgi:hypothetical protein
MDVKDDIKAALEAAASETEESSDEVSESEEEQETELDASEEKEAKAKTESKSKSAQVRIRELVDKSKTLQEQLEEVNSVVGERDTEIGKLVDLLEMKENDSKIIQRINELHTNPQFKDKIEELDYILRTGKLPEKEDATEKSEDSDKKIDEGKLLKNLEETREALEERIADQEAEIILGKADILADRYIEELPDEYNDDDKRLLRELLTDRINWEAIEENPDVLPEAFAEGFQAALNHYGQPKGFVPEPDETDESENREVTLEDLQSKDWGRLREITTPDGKVLKVPAVNDDQFTNVLAEVIRKGNR